MNLARVSRRQALEVFRFNQPAMQALEDTPNFCFKIQGFLHQTRRIDLIPNP
ncbi:MAG: hypothetical protein ACJASJ_001746 [Candidatus Azotimanducaceae bacterium]|jgi:hypothetical protein